MILIAGHGVKAGQPAPDFELPDSEGRVYRLSELRGRVVVLVFLRHLG